jgi:restriction endonuclease S subunit
MTEQITKLPKDWRIEKVSSIANLIRGINYTKDVASNNPSDNSLPILRGNNINIDLNFDDLVYVPKSLIKPEQLIKKDDIIFAMSSGSKHLVGKTAVAKTDFKGSYGAFCALLRINEGINKKYVSYIFKGNTYRKLISEIAKGTSINNLKREHILDFEFPLPPLDTQQAIVSKIEELFSELDKGIEDLKTAQQQLKTYRQSVLKWAFEGKLTNENVKEGLLPKGWEIKILGSVCDLKAGNFVKASEIKEVFNEKLFKCFGGNGLRGYTETYTHEGQHALIGRQGALCGNVHLADGKFHATEHAVVVTTLKNIDMKCLYYKLKEMRLNQFSSGVAQPGLSVNKLLPIEINFPLKIEEQQQIVQEIERRLSVADKMEESIAQSLQQAEALRQSILKKAFSGELIET